MASSHALTLERLAERPLYQFYLVVHNLLLNATPLMAHSALHELVSWIAGKDPAKLLNTQLAVLQPLIAPFEQKREPLGEEADELEEMKTLEAEIKTASGRVNQLPIDFENNKTALNTTLQQLETDRNAALDAETLRIAGEIKDTSSQYLQLDSEKKQLENKITEVQKTIDGKFCSCFPSCVKNELAQKAQLEAQLSAVNAKYTGLEAKLKQKPDEATKQPTNAQIDKLNTDLNKGRDQLANLTPTYEAELKKSREVLSELEEKRTELVVKRKNKTDFYNAWISNELMLECLRIYIRFIQFNDSVNSALAKDASNKNLIGLQLLCIEYQSSLDGLLSEGRLWCPNSNDSYGLQIYGVFFNLSSEIQSKIFDSHLSKEFLAQFLPDKQGYKLASLKADELRIIPDFFKPKASHLRLPQEITHELKATAAP